MASQFQQWLTDKGYEDLFDAFYAAFIRSVTALADYTPQELCNLFPGLPFEVAKKVVTLAVASKTTTTTTTTTSTTPSSTDSQIVLVTQQHASELALMKKEMDLKLLELKFEQSKLAAEKELERTKEEAKKEQDRMKEKSANDLEVQKKMSELEKQVAILQISKTPAPAPAQPPHDGWKLLMKSGVGETFQYDSLFWTQPSTLNPHDTSTNFTDAKFDAFNNAQINEIKIVSATGYETVLRLPCTSTLLALFQGGACHALTYVSGCTSPTALVNGGTYDFYHHTWRLNTKSPNGGIRIGGWFYEIGRAHV